MSKEGGRRVASPVGWARVRCPPRRRPWLRERAKDHQGPQPCRDDVRLSAHARLQAIRGRRWTIWTDLARHLLPRMLPHQAGAASTRCVLEGRGARIIRPRFSRHPHGSSQASDRCVGAADQPVPPTSRAWAPASSFATSTATSRAGGGPDSPPLSRDLLSRGSQVRILPGALGDNVRRAAKPRNCRESAVPTTWCQRLADARFCSSDGRRGLI
jgi:hypothetical protein